jgi:hypothetical protein
MTEKGNFTESGDSPSDDDGECRVSVFLQTGHEPQELWHCLSYEVSTVGLVKGGGADVKTC